MDPLDRSISNSRVSVVTKSMLYIFFKFNANSVDPDQTLCFAASDLGLHCLSMPLLWDLAKTMVEEDA